MHRATRALFAGVLDLQLGRAVALLRGMTFTKILCPTDFSPGAEHALRLAARLAIDTNAELVIAHSWHIPTAAYTLEAPFPPHVVQELVDDAQRGLDVAVRDATAAGVKHVTAKLLSGTPWSEIVGQLERQAFDLCVIGTHGRTGLARVLLGSVAEKVVRHAPCSVLAVHPDGESTTFDRILVPTDFSESATHAAELAATLVQPQGSITLLHVIEVPVAFSGEIHGDFARSLARSATASLDRAATHLRAKTSATVTTCYRMGYPGAQTLAALDADRAIDLVVMGSHGRTGIKRVLLGSVAEKIVRLAHCPVLIGRNRT